MTLVSEERQVTEVGRDPFPFLVLDRVLPEETLLALDRHWPERSDFAIEGHDRHDLRLRLLEQETDDADRLHLRTPPLRERLKSEQATFWHSLLDGPVHDLVLSCLEHFSGFWSRWRPGFRPDFFYQLIWLEDAPEVYAGKGLRVHTHYDSHPLWAMSLILYLNDGNGQIEATHLRWPENCREEDDFVSKALNSRRWYLDPEIAVARKFEFRRNRALVFADGPLSFHGVDAFSSQQLALLGRRLLLVHVAWIPEDFQAAYGMPVNEFRRRLMAHEVDETMRLTVSKDIRAYLGAVREFDPAPVPRSFRLARIPSI